jgi:hypothetical protein
MLRAINKLENHIIWGHLRIYSARARNMATAESKSTHKDPITGEMVSKTCVSYSFSLSSPEIDLIIASELKRREKARERDARKAAVATVTKEQDEKSTVKEDDLNPNVSTVIIARSPSNSSPVYASVAIS